MKKYTASFHNPVAIPTLFCCFVVICLSMPACINRDKKHPSSSDTESSPALTANESMKTMKLEEGFIIKLVADEPLVNSPVAISFDEKGRIWVAEMQSYMPDTAGTGEDAPTGKIVILEDTNKDGRADKRTIFLDSLVLPRAICLIEDGILIAEPPALWFVKIKNNKPAEKILVDADYASGGNVEHQPNGLYRGFDNWIYNSEGDKRYKKAGDRWLIERMYSRGQWGISQDDFGRLFYNNNSANLLGDFFQPGIGPYNKNQRTPAGFNERIVRNDRVYPLRPTTGVNRGYMEEVLDEQNRLVEFTAASGPVIYRGDLFGKEYYGNAFVGEPSANLIKRNILTNEGYKVNGRQAYEGKEFLSSTDERFRPVTLYNGPDGALYVVDMYRGIIQHKTYLTSYLKDQIKARELDKPINCGRIYKIVPENKNTQALIFPEDNTQLVKLLEHPNGWVRDKTMQLLIDRKQMGLAPQIRQLLKTRKNDAAIIAISLWTLQNLGVVQSSDILPLLNDNEWPLRMTGLGILPTIINENNYKQFLPTLQKMINESDTLAFPFIAYIANSIVPYEKEWVNDLLTMLTERYPDNRFIADAVISNLQDQESAFLEKLITKNADTSLFIYKRLTKLIQNIDEKKNSRNSEILKKQFLRGAELFQTICQTCHGADGNGITALGPPLNRSEWVTGKKDDLISIVLFGLKGPVTVNGKQYGPPETNAEMPGLTGNKELTDADIAEVMSFIRKSWSNNASVITGQEVKALKSKYKGRQKPFNADELIKAP
ncbi:MAG: c-type cytochrome [Chitinophagaceae bacterium]|nr:c-type cytochrome [Chitinophagaceae bacterium]